jgi:hypothetical protein
MTKSILVKKQVKTFKSEAKIIDGISTKLEVTVRYDDKCGNGHNTFSITGDLYEGWRLVSCGRLHDEIAELLPELTNLIKWHLVSPDGPMHYIANTTYFAKEGDLPQARNSAVWPDATLSQLQDDKALMDRLPALMCEFREKVEDLGMIY